MVEFQGKFDENVTKRVNRHTIKKLWWLFALFSVFFILIGVLGGIVFREDDSDIIFGAVMIIFGVLFAPLVFVSTNATQKKLDKTMSVLSPDTTQTFQFYPDKIVFTQEKKRWGEEDSEYYSTTTAKYTYFYKAEETKDAYFLRISRMQYHVVNKSDLKQGTIEELNSILSSNLGARFKRFKKL